MDQLYNIFTRIISYATKIKKTNSAFELMFKLVVIREKGNLDRDHKETVNNLQVSKSMNEGSGLKPASFTKYKILHVKNSFTIV